MLQSRQFNQKTCPALCAIAAADLSPVALDDPVTHAQPQSRALSYWPSGVKRVEYLAGLSHSRTIVCKLHNYLSSFCACRDAQHSIAALRKRMRSVVDDVRKDLQQLIRVSMHSRQRFRQGD